MAEKKNFIMRIDAATHKALEKWAADEFRSINGQVEYLLHKALQEAGRLNNVSQQKKQNEQKNK
ncbi:MAG: hypothetical protein PW786_09270 [Arachidicoccus sp.]|nr:hypothetical protein [Arachidicoccus sp.]